MIRVSVFFLSLMTSSLAFANGFVGNAGSGVSINGVIFVQDLYSVGAHKNPFVGPTTDMRLPALKKLTFSFPEALLLKKLTDLNKAVPHLGDFLALAMNEYDWVLVDEELVLLKEGDDPVKLPAGAERVQLANRLQGLIRINSQGWNKLDEANKVALLIHEAVYSLLAPNAAQGAQTARYLTGQFFLSGFKDSNLALKLRHDPMILGLSVPNEAVANPPWHISTELKVRLPNRTSQPSASREDYFRFYEKDLFSKVLGVDCRKSYERLLDVHGQALEMTVAVDQNILKAKSYSYKVSEMESQIAVQIEATTFTTLFQSSLIRSVDDCVDFGVIAFSHVLSR